MNACISNSIQSAAKHRVILWSGHTGHWFWILHMSTYLLNWIFRVMLLTDNVLLVNYIAHTVFSKFYPIETRILEKIRIFRKDMELSRGQDLCDSDWFVCSFRQWALRTVPYKSFCQPAPGTTSGPASQISHHYVPANSLLARHTNNTFGWLRWKVTALETLNGNVNFVLLNGSDKDFRDSNLCKLELVHLLQKMLRPKLYKKKLANNQNQRNVKRHRLRAVSHR